MFNISQQQGRKDTVQEMWHCIYYKIKQLRKKKRVKGESKGGGERANLYTQGCLRLLNKLT